MALTVCFAVLLHILVHFTSGQDLAIFCSKPMLRTTAKNHKSDNVTCVLNKDAFAKACGSLPTLITFSVTNKYGKKFPYCKANTTSCPNEGMVLSTGSCLSSACSCVQDDGTHITFIMNFHPSLAESGGSFSCETNCEPTSGVTPSLVVSDGCKNVNPVNPCGGCSDGEGCDEISLKCVGKMPGVICKDCPVSQVCNKSTLGCVEGPTACGTICFTVITVLFSLVVLCVLLMTILLPTKCVITRKVLAAADATGVDSDLLLGAQKEVQQEKSYTCCPLKAYKENGDVMVKARYTYHADLEALVQKVKEKK